MTSRLVGLLRLIAVRLRRKTRPLDPPDPFAYDEELVPVGGSPHRSGAVVLDEPRPVQRTDARSR